MADARDLAADDAAWEARLSERTSLADALHDGVLQEVIALRQDCGDAVAGVAGALEAMQRGLDRMTKELRALTGALHEASLDEVTLAVAVDRMAEALRDRARLTIRVDVGPAAGAYNDPVVRETVRELMNNVAQHANATTLDVEVTLVGEVLELRVTDDGVGFTPRAAAVARGAGHIGLARIHRLTDRLGGVFIARRRAPHGTVVVVRLPASKLQTRDIADRAAPIAGPRGPEPTDRSTDVVGHGAAAAFEDFFLAAGERPESDRDPD